MCSASIFFAAFVTSEAFYVCLAGGGSGSCGSSVSEAAQTAASVASGMIVLILRAQNDGGSFRWRSKKLVLSVSTPFGVWQRTKVIYLSLFTRQLGGQRVVPSQDSEDTQQDTRFSPLSRFRALC